MRNFFENNQRIIKFLISGGTATLVDLFLLYGFTDLLKIWYLGSAVMAFVFAFMVSFGLQKFWTFNGEHSRQSKEQLIMYLSVNLVNLGINSAGIYLLVDKVGAWYLFSQVMMSGLIAFESYFVYKLVIFKESTSVIPAKAGTQLPFCHPREGEDPTWE
jgi:putative flippase GtrA